MARTTGAFPDDQWRRELLQMQETLRKASGADSIQRLQDAINKAGGLREMQRLSDQIRESQRVALQPQFRDLQRLAATFSRSQDWQRVAEQISGANAFQQMADQIRQTMRPDFLKQISGQIASVGRANYSPETLDQIREALEAFERTAEQASEEPPESPEEPDAAEGEGEFTLGWWLASRPLSDQIALLVAGLQVLSNVTAVLATASGQSLPPILQPATQLCFTTVAFLLLWLTLSSSDDDGDTGDDGDGEPEAEE
jgi:hypothetical protein